MEIYPLNEKGVCVGPDSCWNPIGIIWKYIQLNHKDVLIGHDSC